MEFAKRINSFIKDPFWKNVFTLFSGTLIAQVIPLLIFPLLTRIYSKDEIGVYFLYSSIILVLQITSSLQYHLAIVLPVKDKDADNLLKLNIILSFITGFLYFSILYLFSNFFYSIIDEKQLHKWLYFIPLSTLLLGLTNSFTFYFNRFKQYKKITNSRFVKSGSIALLQLLFGYTGYYQTGMIYSLIIADLLSALILIFYLIKDHQLNFKIEIKPLIILLKKYKDIPLYNTLLTFLNTLSNQLPIFLLTRFFGTSTASDYGLSNKIVNTPMGMIASSVGQVFFQESSDYANQKKDLTKLVKSTYLKLFKISIIPFIVIFIFAPFLFKILFTSNYESAGIYTRILIPWFFIGFLNMPITYVLTTLNKQKVFLLANILLITTRFASLFAGYYWFNSSLASLVFFSSVGIIYNIFIFFYIIHISKHNKSAYYNIK